MKLYEMTEHKGGGMAARFYIDGKRVSRERYEYIETRAYTSGGCDTFYTKGRALEGGKIRRTNHKVARVT